MDLPARMRTSRRKQLPPSVALTIQPKYCLQPINQYTDSHTSGNFSFQVKCPTMYTAHSGAHCEGFPILQGSPEGSMCFESAFSIWYCFPYSQSRSQGVEMRMIPFTVTPSIPVRTFLLPDSMALFPAVLEIWVLESGLLL